MSETSLDHWIEELSPEQPCGEDLSYDPTYLQLESLASGQPEQQMGESVHEGHDPEWGQLRSKTEELMQRTRDLRVATFWCLAQLNLKGLEGFRDGIEVIQRLTEEHWEHVHPQLDPDDGNDPLERVNILQSLSPTTSVYRDPMMFIQRLREANLATAQQMGKVSMRDVMLARGELETTEDTSGPDTAMIQAIFADTPVEQLHVQQESLQDISTRLKSMITFLDETIGAQVSPDFSRLVDEVAHMQAVLGEFLNTRIPGDAVEDGEAVAGDESGEQRRPASGGFGGEVTSRADVMVALDRICSYYEKNEPSHPIPFMLKRAKRLVGMSFVDIIRDLSPDAMGQAENVFGMQAEDGND